MEVVAEVKDFLDGRRDDLLAYLKSLVRMESPTDDAASQQPILDLLAESFAELGYRCLRLPGHRFGGCLYARPPRRRSGTGRCRQLLLGHCDTVWPLGSLQTMPLEQDGDILRGPGVYDMKAGLTEIVFALRAVHGLGLEPAVEPLVFINSDEELGSRESTRHIRRLATRVDRALVMEPSLGSDGRLKTARKGVGRFEITVRGKAAHAGLDPTAGASAILELSHVIQKLFALNDPAKGASVNVGLIDGGVRANVIAPASSAVVDLRVTSHEDGRRIEEAIRALTPDTPGVTLEISGGLGRPPMEANSANQQLWRVATNVAEELGMPLAEGAAGGGSDGNTTSQYTATLDGLGAVGDGAHAAHEHVRIDHLAQRTALLTMLILAPPLGSA